MDLRERVVAAVDAGLTQRQAAVRFGVSLRTVERYLARRRATGGLAATEQRHGPEPTVRRQLQAWLPERLGAAADATLAEHVGAFVAAGGEPGSPGSMSRAIAGPPPRPRTELAPGGRRRGAGRPVKQKACPPPSATRTRARSGAGRCAGWIGRGECSSTSAARAPSMPRRKARAVRGVRARGAVP